MKILTIIPARCGSKGIKDKNIIDVCGQPLISYSIKLACKLKDLNFIDTVFVSTDCDKIAKVSEKFGADVPILRPEELSTDKSKSIDFYLHAIEYFEKKNILFDAILLLQPTSPIRNLDTLKKAIELFIQNNNDSLISVYEEEYINDLVMYKESTNNNLKPLNNMHNKGVRRQEHGSIYVRNGAIYLTSVEYIKKERMIISDNPLFVKMKKSDSINIDTMEDLELVRLRCKDLKNS